MFLNFLEHIIKCFQAAITKKPHFLPKNGQKKTMFWPNTVFWGPEWSVVGPPTLFGRCWTEGNVFCKFLERVIECFGAAITKKPHFLPTNGQKKPFLSLKHWCWGLSGQL